MAAGHEKSTWNNIFSLLYSKTRVSPSVDTPLQAAWFLPDIVEDAARSNAWVADALQASEQRYKLLLSSVTDYIFTIELKDGLPVSTSHGQGCVAVTGYTPEDYAQIPSLWYEMVHPEDRHAVIGEGEIGLEALLNVLRHPKLKDLPFYLETPLDDAGHKEEIARLKEYLGEE